MGWVSFVCFVLVGLVYVLFVFEGVGGLQAIKGNRDSSQLYIYSMYIIVYIVILPPSLPAKQRVRKHMPTDFRKFAPQTSDRKKREKKPDEL